MDNLTIMMWFKADKMDNTGTVWNLFTKYTAIVDAQVAIGNNVINCQIVTTGSATASATMGVPTVNRWHLHACTYDGANIKQYLDGALIATVAQTGIIQKTDGSIIFRRGYKSNTKMVQ